MTTTLENVLTPESEPAVLRRGRVWPRVLAGFVIGFLLCLGVAGGALLAYDASFEGRVLTGVSVGGADLSGLDHDQASAKLQASFAGYGEGRVVIRTTAGDVVVPYAAFSRRPDVEAMVDEALRTGRAGTPIERAVAEVRLAMSGLSLEPRLVLDPAALNDKVKEAVAPLERVAVDSTIVKTLRSIYTMPAQPGRTFDAPGAAAAALAVVGRTDAPDEVVVEATATEIPPAHPDGEALAAMTAADRMIKDVVVTKGKKRWKIKAATVRTWIRFETAANGSSWPVADQAAIARSLKKVAKAVRVAPMSATYLKTRSGRIVGVAAAADGKKLDAAATAKVIAKNLANRGLGAVTTPVKLKLAKVPPKLSTEEASKKAPLMVELGSWKTWFPISERNYFGANIWLPAEIIDGTVLMPGQRFEWWSALGPVTSGRGFGPGGFIAGDHTEPTGALGGGMCSSSTTLFNAALRAGLQMGSRANHRYYINRYPLGLDATVSKTRNGTQTVSFTNDMKKPIVIRTFRYRAGGRGWVRYEIWGVPDGRKVSLSKASVSNVRKATTNVVYVSTLRKGVRVQTEYPANGMTVSVSRVVRNRNGRVIHSNTYRTHYALWNGRIEVGR